LNIKDIASLTGLSVATVSRVINNQSSVTKETREKVEKVIKETGYTPNFLGRNLRVSKTQKILVIIPTISNLFYSEILEAIQDASTNSGFNILIGITNNDPELENKYMELLTTKQVDGAILFLSQFDKELMTAWSKKFPIVQCCEYTRGSDVTNVSIDNKQGAYDAVSYLISRGHTKIGAIRGQLYFASEADRTDGYMQALSDNRIERDLKYSYVTEYTMEGGKKGAEALMRLENPPTAIFAYGDTIAIGVIKTLKDMKKIVMNRKDGKRNVAVIGFDDIPLCTLFTPTISTVEQPKYQLGITAFNLLMEKMNNPDMENKSVVLPHRLIIRQSSEF